MNIRWGKHNQYLSSLRMQRYLKKNHEKKRKSATANNNACRCSTNLQPAVKNLIIFRLDRSKFKETAYCDFSFLFGVKYCEFIFFLKLPSGLASTGTYGKQTVNHTKILEQFRFIYNIKLNRINTISHRRLNSVNMLPFFVIIV